MDTALWMYASLALVTALPLIPNSAVLATAGALAAVGRLDLSPVLLAPLAGALAGDLAVYRAGSRARGRVLAWVARHPKRRAVTEWAAARVGRHGIPAVIAMRFVPCGRFLGGLTTGLVAFGTRRYLIGAGIAELIFVACTVGLGYAGGLVAATSGSALAIGPAVSLAVAAATAAAQRASRRREVSSRDDAPGVVIPWAPAGQAVSAQSVSNSPYPPSPYPHRLGPHGPTPRGKPHRRRCPHGTNRLNSPPCTVR
ncbi:DedA family protein [Streptomyces sp. NPDC048639]|uniref:DedA family protein n=1 Tax=Streptomyces sp. NPDC048639 TaxID=3365581 RepID=UPI00371499C5